MRFLMLLSLCLGLLSAADTRPNFTGTWKMDTDRSDFGQIPKPAKFERKIEHEEPKLHVVSSFTTPNGDAVTDVKYTTDGKECVNTVRGGEWTSTTTWDGNSIEVASKRTINGAEVTTKERWTLTGKGKVLTVVNNTVTPQATVTFTVVMDRQ